MMLEIQPVDRVLEVENLKTHFYQDEGIVKAVDGISFTVDRGKTLGIIGESGCGKSVTVHTIMRLIPEPPARIVEGSIRLYGVEDSKGGALDLAKLRAKDEQLCRIRGKEIGMVFQEPMTALSPVHTVGNQIMEAILIHEPEVTKKEARQRAVELLSRVGLPDPERSVDAYSHQLSGGMRQRALISMALACSPRLLIADEPTTALDVTVEAQILELLIELQEEIGLAMIYITHNLAVVSEIADEVAVMYLGKIVEHSTKEQVFTNPLHPYTWALMRSIPVLEGELNRLIPVRGGVPSPYETLPGCPFHPRCEYAIPGICDVGAAPELLDVGDGHKVRCVLYDDAVMAGVPGLSARPHLRSEFNAE